MGVTVGVDKIQKTNSALPSAIVAKIHALVFGESLSVVEVRWISNNQAIYSYFIANNYILS